MEPPYIEPSGEPAKLIKVVAFGLAWWLGLYLLARDVTKPALRRPPACSSSRGAPPCCSSARGR